MHTRSVFGVDGAEREIETQRLRISLWHCESARLDAATKSRRDAHCRDLAACRHQFARTSANHRRLLGCLHAFGARTSRRKARSAARASRPRALAITVAQGGPGAA